MPKIKVFKARVSPWLILLFFINVTIGFGVGYVAQELQKLVFCPAEKCIFFGTIKQMAMIAILYLVVINFVFYFFKLRNRLINVIYLILTVAFLLGMYLMFHFYLVVAPTYLEVHAMQYSYPFQKVSEVINYDDVIQLQYYWSGSRGGRRSPNTCQLNVAFHLKNGYFNLMSYGYGTEVWDKVRQFRDFPVNGYILAKNTDCHRTNNLQSIP